MRTTCMIALAMYSCLAGRAVSAQVPEYSDDEEKDRAVALMRRVEAGVKASMSYCINRAVSISSDPFDLVGILVGGDKINSVNNLCRR